MFNLNNIHIFWRIFFYRIILYFVKSILQTAYYKIYVFRISIVIILIEDMKCADVAASIPVEFARERFKYEKKKKMIILHAL